MGWPATSSTMTAVMKSKLLHILVDVLRAKVLLNNVGIGNSNVEEKVKYVLVCNFLLLVLQA